MLSPLSVAKKTRPLVATLSPAITNQWGYQAPGAGACGSMAAEVSDIGHRQHTFANGNGLVKLPRNIGWGG